MSMRPNTQEALTRMQRDRERATTRAAEELARHVDAEALASTQQMASVPTASAGRPMGTRTVTMPTQEIESAARGRGSAINHETLDRLRETISGTLTARLDSDMQNAFSERLMATPPYPDPTSFGIAPGSPYLRADFDGDILGRITPGTGTASSGFTISANPRVTMDEAISKLMQLISDSLVEGTTIEYNDAVSDILEVIEKFRTTQIEVPKPQSSGYEEILRGLCSRSITETVKRVFHSYRYSPGVPDDDLLPHLRESLSGSLNGMVSHLSEVISVKIGRSAEAGGAVQVDVGFKISKDDTIINTQRVILNDDIYRR